MPAKARQGAATYVPVSLDEMDKVIRRGFRALRPRVEKSSWGEILYFLTPEDDEPENVIRIQTSIFDGSQARGEGEDSIRITIVNTKTKKPIAGKMQRVHRTQNWKDNLRSRIEDAVEEFETLKEDREKAKQMLTVREEQQKFVQENPDQAKEERKRQIAMLEFLSRSRSYNALKFNDMLTNYMRQRPLLTENQLRWVEKEYKAFGGRPL